MPMSQVYDKLKVKGLLKPLDPRPIPNPLPSSINVNKRCAYHQGLGRETDHCFTIRHAIQDLVDNKVIAPPTRPSITNNPLPNHNFGKRRRINCLMTEEENKEDPSNLIYDLLECFMITWEELMDFLEFQFKTSPSRSLFPLSRSLFLSRSLPLLISWSLSFPPFFLPQFLKFLRSGLGICFVFPVDWGTMLLLVTLTFFF